MEQIKLTAGCCNRLVQQLHAQPAFCVFCGASSPPEEKFDVHSHHYNHSARYSLSLDSIAPFQLKCKFDCKKQQWSCSATR